MINRSILTGQRVVLRPLTEEHVLLMARWFFLPDVERWLLISEDPPELRTAEAVLERYQRIWESPVAVTWVIETQAGQIIGAIELSPISALHRRAELSLLIGEASARGQGYGTDAIRTLLRYAFGPMGLRRVTLIVDEDNAQALRCYAKCGFQVEGLLRAHRLRYGEPVNMVSMGMLREELQEE